MSISRSELDLGLWRTQASFLGYSESGGSCWEDEFKEDGGMTHFCSGGLLRVAALQGGVRPTSAEAGEGANWL